jgi:hypothetical protein
MGSHDCGTRHRQAALDAAGHLPLHRVICDNAVGRGGQQDDGRRRKKAPVERCEDIPKTQFGVMSEILADCSSRGDRRSGVALSIVFPIYPFQMRVSVLITPFCHGTTRKHRHKSSLFLSLFCSRAWNGACGRQPCKSPARSQRLPAIRSFSRLVEDRWRSSLPGSTVCPT